MNNLKAQLDKLYIFEAICRHGTIHKASVELRLTQPSVSRALQTLEKAVGMTLITRGRQGSVPTTAGQLVLRYAKTVLNGALALREELAHPGDPFQGHIQVGSYESLAEYLWPDFLINLRKKHPQFKIDIRTSQSNDPYKLLANHDLDILVDAEPPQKEGFVSYRLYSDKFGVFGKSSSDSSMLAMNYPIIYVPHASDHKGRQLGSILGGAQNSQAHEIHLDSFSTVRRFILKGAGIGVLPIRLAEADLAAGRLKWITRNGLPTSGFGSHYICATILERRVDDPRLKAFLQELRAFLNQGKGL